MDITIFVNIKKEFPLSKAATDEFVKRLRPYCNLCVIHTMKPSAPISGDNVQNICITPASKSDIKTISSEKFAANLQTMAVKGISKINYYIGYDPSFTYNLIPFAITSVTPDLAMTEIALCEQIYRAYMINNHITYHK